MTARTFAFGDIHGDLAALRAVMAKLPSLTYEDTLLFVGDYLDRGPNSAQVIHFIKDELPGKTAARIVTLRGNHEDAWLRVTMGGWPEFVLPPPNGCLATLRSYTGALFFEGDQPTRTEHAALLTGAFFPDDHLEWMTSLPYWYEDEHAIYVHAGLPQEADGAFQHPRTVANKAVLLWVRTIEFFRDYRGKRVVVGHTSTDYLPPELSSFTPEDPLDMWAGDSVLAIDTGAGKGGFLTCVELPAVKVYESR
ncbi:MAG: serine/threonine protein phosphatase [Myxococcales bacterium]|nr:serine/threonine protein phosphatase [Myxococcales bacterium]